MSSLSVQADDNDYDNNRNDDHDDGHDDNYDDNYDDDHDDDHDDEHDDNHKNNSISKRSNESEVWLFFKKVVWEKKQKTAKCDIPKCKHKPFSCGSGGTTNPLWRHLESSHWSQYVTTKEYRRKKKKVQNKNSNIEEIFERVSYYLFL